MPISLVWKEPLERNGQRPMYLQAYGSYGINFDPSFSSHYLSLLDRGFIVGIAHVRGGEEMGRRWYDDGKQKKKRNTFTDFIACAEYLVAQGYTSSDRLAITGGSAGGLLMGAVTNLRPDLFATVVADVPFVDVVNTMLDPTLPLTVIEYDEWGNPTADESAYRYILSYSPYDNVAAEGVSQPARHGRAQRSARRLLGTGQVDRKAPRAEDRRQPAAPAHQHGCRPRRCQRALRLPARSSLPLRLCPGHD